MKYCRRMAAAIVILSPVNSVSMEELRWNRRMVMRDDDEDDDDVSGGA